MGVTWEIYSQELEQQLVFTPRQGGVLLLVKSAEGEWEGEIDNVEYLDFLWAFCKFCILC